VIQCGHGPSYSAYLEDAAGADRLPLHQARWSPIDFDYLGYAELRWGEYRRRKLEFLAAAEAVS